DRGRGDGPGHRAGCAPAPCARRRAPAGSLPPPVRGARPVRARLGESGDLRQSLRGRAGGQASSARGVPGRDPGVLSRREATESGRTMRPSPTPGWALVVAHAAAQGRGGGAGGGGAGSGSGGTTSYTRAGWTTTTGGRAGTTYTGGGGGR